MGAAILASVEANPAAAIEVLSAFASLVQAAPSLLSAILAIAPKNAFLTSLAANQAQAIEVLSVTSGALKANPALLPSVVALAKPLIKA